MEIWKTIDGTNGRYSVSNLGNVKRNEHYTTVNPSGSTIRYKDRLLKPSTDSNGYFVVKLQVENNKSIVKKIHRLVAETFIPNPDNLPCVNHRDENMQNNCVENLEWCTHLYNAQYGARNDKIRKASSIRVAQYTLDGKLIKIWDSMSQAAIHFGAKTPCYITRVCKNKKGRHSYKGFLWKYVDQKIIGDSELKEQTIKNKNALVSLIINTFSKEELQNIIDNYERTT